MAEKKQVWTALKPHANDAMGILLSDVVGAGVGLGGMAIFEELAPNQLKKIEHIVGRGLVKCVPGLDKFGARFANLSPEETEKFKLLSLDEQGQIVAKPVTNLMIAGLLSLGSGMASQSWYDKHYGNQHGPGVVTKTRWIDFSVQTVSMALINTLGNKQATAATKVFSKILQNTFGMPKERADYLGSYFARYEVPNLIGNAANLICLHKFGNGNGITPHR